jgi:hypothetical protein
MRPDIQEPGMIPSVCRTIHALAAPILFAAITLAAPAAHAKHGLIAGANSCVVLIGMGQQCDSHTTNSEFGEAGAEANLGGAQRAAVVQGYGEFHGSAQAALTNVSTGDDGEVARAGVQGTVYDTWVIGGGTGLGYLQLGYSVTGATASSGSGPGYASDAYLQTGVLSVAHTPGGSVVTGQANSDYIYGSSFAQLTGSIPFYFGQALDLTFITYVQASTGYSQDFFGTTYSGSAQAGFADTALLTSIQAFDAQGHLIPGITISAESGAIYPLAAEVPEPTTTGLMALGLGMLGGTKLRRRRSTKR